MTKPLYFINMDALVSLMDTKDIPVFDFTQFVIYLVGKLKLDVADVNPNTAEFYYGFDQDTWQTQHERFVTLAKDMRNFTSIECPRHRQTPDMAILTAVESLSVLPSPGTIFALFTAPPPETWISIIHSRGCKLHLLFPDTKYIVQKDLIAAGAASVTNLATVKKASFAPNPVPSHRAMFNGQVIADNTSEQIALPANANDHNTHTEEESLVSNIEAEQVAVDTLDVLAEIEPEKPAIERVVLVIDNANTDAAFKAQGISRINYLALTKSLIGTRQSVGRYFVSRFPENDLNRNFYKFLRKNCGFVVIAPSVKPVNGDQSDDQIIIENLAAWSERADTVILASGDRHYVEALQALKAKDKRIEVASTPTHASSEMQLFDDFINVSKIEDAILVRETKEPPQPIAVSSTITLTIDRARILLDMLEDFKKDPRWLDANLDPQFQFDIQIRH